METQEAIIRYNAITVDLGIGVFLLCGESFRIALGQSLDFGNVRIEGKRGPSTLIRGQIFGRYVNELNFGTTSLLHFMIALRGCVGPGIFVRPYFQACLRPNDYQPLNSAFRPVESLKDSQFILGRQSKYWPQVRGHSRQLGKQEPSRWMHGGRSQSFSPFMAHSSLAVSKKQCRHSGS
jgi:hypothetical protein